MATLKQKIENLTWSNLTKELKNLLLDFNTKLDNITGRISLLQSTSVTTADVYNIINGTSITLPTYADNAAAVAGGLAVGRLYKTVTGEIRVRV